MEKYNIYIDFDLVELFLPQISTHDVNEVIEFDSLDINFNLSTLNLDNNIIVTGNRSLKKRIKSSGNVLLYDFINDDNKTFSTTKQLSILINNIIEDANETIIVDHNINLKNISNEINRINVAQNRIYQIIESNLIDHDIKNIFEKYNIISNEYDIYDSKLQQLIIKLADKKSDTIETVGSNNFNKLYAVVFNQLIRKTKLESSKEKNMFNILNNIRFKYNDKWIFPDKYDVESFNRAINAVIKEGEMLSILTGVEYIKPEIIFSTTNNFENYYNRYTENSKLWIEDSISFKIDIDRLEHVKILEYYLDKLFGFKEFREGQLEIISNILNGNNTLGILTTGAGKSLTYYFAVLMQPQISWIIAPINALIVDQENILINRYGIKTISTLLNESREHYELALNNFINNKSQFIFSSPERLLNLEFRKILKERTENKEIGTIIFDEVHCLSEWGHDFRVAYLMVTTTINSYASNVNYLGLTATASVRVLKDLMSELSVTKNNVKYSKNLKRDNLNFKIKTFSSKESAVNAMKSKLIEFKQDENKSALIFSRNIKSSGGNNYNKFALNPLMESISNNKYFSKNEYDIYHSGNRKSHEPFIEDEVKILFCTKSFGMGIDKPNIGLTIHMGMPSSREAFYQEAGRAGRDGENSECILYSVAPNISQRDVLREYFREDFKKIYSVSNLDISSNIYFFENDLVEPKQESQITFDLYMNILEGARGFRFNSNSSKSHLDKYLYILHRVGVISNWSIDYTDGFYGGIYNIEITEKYNNLDYQKEYVFEYIKYRVGNKEDEEINKNNILNQHDFKSLVYEFRVWYYDNFIKTRKRELENMYLMINESNKSLKTSSDIQNAMESYFDIESFIGETNEGYSLEFKNNSISEVLDFAFNIEKNNLDTRYYQSERILESYPDNQKLIMYLSIITLRMGKFISSINGEYSFKKVIDKISVEDAQIIVKDIVNNFDKLEDTNKNQLISCLINIKKFDKKDYLIKILNTNYENKHIINIVYEYINYTVGEVL